MTKPITDQPGWFSDELSTDTKNQLIDQDFDIVVAESDTLKNADPETLDYYRAAHRQLLEEAEAESEHNPINKAGAHAQSVADRSNVFKNTLTKALESHEDAYNRKGLVDDVFTGADDSTAENVSNIFLRRRNQILTKEQKELSADITKAEKKLSKDGFWNDAAAYAELAWDVASNPGAILHTAAESSSSMTSMAVGAKTGALAGPLGSLAGIFGAGTIDASTHKLFSEVQDTMLEQGYKITPSNVKNFMENNPDFFDKARSKSIKYGAVLGLVDAVTGGLVGKIATLPTRAARQAAVRSIAATDRAVIEAAAKAGNKSFKEITESMIAGQTQKNLAAASFKSKLGYKGAAVAGETASEPLSEAVATASVGDEIKAADLIYETIGGIGSGPIGTAVAVSAFGTKVGKDQTVEFAKKLAASKEVKEETKAQKETATEAVKQSRSAANKGFKEDTSSVTEVTDERIDQWVEQGDPIKAVTALSKFDSVEAVDKAREIHNNMLPELVQLQTDINEMQERADTLTPHENDQLKAKLKQFDAKMTTKERILKQIDIMKASAQSTAPESTSKLDPETATSEDVKKSITESFGSHGKSSLSLDQIEALEKSTNLTDDDKALLSAVKEAEQFRQEFTKPSTDGKTMEQVSTDIYYGERGSEFKGIDAYKQAIAHYMNPTVGNKAAAQKQLEGLIKFRDSHVAKADEFSKALDEAQKTNLPYGAGIMVQHKGKPYEIHKNSARFVAGIQQEAAALTSEVKLAETFMKSSTAPAKPQKAAAKPKPKPAPKVEPQSKPEPQVEEVPLPDLEPDIAEQPEPVNEQVSEPVNESVSLEDRKRKAKRSAHDNNRAMNDTGHDVRLRDLQVYEMLDGFFESQATEGKVQSQQVADGHGQGGTLKTVRDGSVNPEWIQKIYADYDYNYKKVVKAIQNALKGTTKPGSTQALVVTDVINAMLEEADAAGVKWENAAILESLDQSTAWLKETPSENTQEQVKEEKEEEAPTRSGDLRDIQITYKDAAGNETTEAYSVAIEQLNREVAECKKFRLCVNGQ